MIGSQFTITRTQSSTAHRLCRDDGSQVEANQRRGEQEAGVAELVRLIYRYSRDNLALVNVYIKNPVVTQIRWAGLRLWCITRRITRLPDTTPQYSAYAGPWPRHIIQKCRKVRFRRDQKIPVIWFVANSGGILGLCMGFSMVTVRFIASGHIADFILFWLDISSMLIFRWIFFCKLKSKQKHQFN